MKPNPNWTTWIYSSFINYFRTQCVGINLPIFIPGQTRNPNINSFCELRTEGPYFNELTAGYWKIESYVAILLTMPINESDMYKLHNTSGLILNMFDRDIPMFRNNTDKTQLGCMRLAPNSKIVQNVYNQFQPALPVSQSSIEAHYHMELCFTEEKLQP